MCLLIGVVGIAATPIQLALIKPLEHVFANAEDIIVGNFTQNIENEITNAIGIDSAAYAATVNKWLDDTATSVNNKLFGFANTATHAVNNTIMQFYQSIETGVHTMFDGTAFVAPVIEFLRCVVGNKVFALENGLAWLRQNCACRTPRSATATARARRRRAGSGRAFESYRKVLCGEVFMFSAFLGVYALVLLSVLIILIVKSTRRGVPALCPLRRKRSTRRLRMNE